MHYELGWIDLKQLTSDTWELQAQRFTPQGPATFASCGVFNTKEVTQPERYQQRFEEALRKVGSQGWERCAANGPLIRHAVDTPPTHEYCSITINTVGSKGGGWFSKETFLFDVTALAVTPQGWDSLQNERVEGQGFQVANSRHDSMVAHLQSEGWRETGHQKPTIMVREIGSQAGINKPENGGQDPLTVLERLAKLRDRNAISLRGGV